MSNPVRLYKQEENPMIFNIDEKVEAFLMKYAPLILFICTILMMVLLIALCFALLGNGAVESGTTYNHMENII